jgi:hypothetical protein
MREKRSQLPVVASSLGISVLWFHYCTNKQIHFYTMLLHTYGDGKIAFSFNVCSASTRSFA